ncbi:MAG: excinuclease ABC subunit UvrC [Nitrosomonas sp.]|nr:excinuclease ABC subunit UvrC [Nitrosomonas sp.]
MAEDPFDGKAFALKLPAQPGVYRMLNAAQKVIYVGKAINLRKRVVSYFRQSGSLSPRIQLMVSQVAGIETTVTRSEAEALILENNLIKSLAPRYNILFRDDKSYPYLKLTRHDYPRLVYYRGALDNENQYFGPFPNAGVVKSSIQLLQKVFRLRTCQNSVFNHRTRPCLLYQIKRCSGPCVGLVTEEDYREDVRNATLFLQGKQQEVLKVIEAKMLTAADELNFEQAALFRDQMQSLRKIQEKQFVDSGRLLDADVIACVAGEDGSVAVNLVMIRGGRHLGDKTFFPQNAQEYDLNAILETFVAQHYLQRSTPPLIILGEKINVTLLQDLLSEQAGHKITLTTHPIADRRKWLDMAAQNAQLALQQRINQQAGQENRLQALQTALDLPGLKRIECFDISHTMGEATMASCVVYDDMAERHNEYRRYNITGNQPGDDYAAMRDVLQRRYARIAAGEGKLPDLILIDGGKGQVNIAYEVMLELGLGDIPLLGVAKGEARKPGLEQLVYPLQTPTVRLPSDHPGLHLIQQIRDEAHRFAIQGHRAKRAKARNVSDLEQITGIGAKRRQSLLTRFGGLKGVKNASIDELQQTEGISRALAEKIYREIR